MRSARTSIKRRAAGWLLASTFLTGNSLCAAMQRAQRDDIPGLSRDRRNSWRSIQHGAVGRRKVLGHQTRRDSGTVSDESPLGQRRRNRRGAWLVQGQCRRQDSSGGFEARESLRTVRHGGQRLAVDASLLPGLLCQSAKGRSFGRNACWLHAGRSGRVLVLPLVAESPCHSREKPARVSRHHYGISHCEITPVNSKDKNYA
jgi:hypothetical protein